MNIDELICYVVRQYWYNRRDSPADPRAVFSANKVGLRAPQGSAELAVGITLAAAVRYVRF